MKIIKHLLKNWKLLIGYFTGKTFKEWKSIYNKNPRRFNHDEPWLTLVATYALFGEQCKMNQPNRIKAFNLLLKSSNLDNVPKIKSIEEIQVEKQLPEVEKYNEVMRDHVFHYFPDIITRIIEKKRKGKTSFEGNTHVDLFIRGTDSDGKKICFFIEAKFNSDISHDIKYNPVRDQIIRNIDSAIEVQQKSKDVNKNKGIIDDIFFLLLTPKIFRTESYGGNRKTSLDIFKPQRSRLYCYKMDEYKNPLNLKSALPHRNEISSEHWQRLARNIGWITFEDINRVAFDNDTMAPPEKEIILEFMNERNMIEK